MLGQRIITAIVLLVLLAAVLLSGSDLIVKITPAFAAAFGKANDGVVVNHSGACSASA